MRYTRAELYRWIRAIDDRSRARCRDIAARLRAAPHLLHHIRNTGDGPDRLFAALLTGDFQLLRRESFAPGWISWIEGQAPHHWLMNHDRVMVDLIPARRRGSNIVDAFEDKYHCTPAQFARLIEAMSDSVRINVRNGALGDYAADVSIDAMGEILALSERFPESFYRLDPIRETAFTLLGVDFGEHGREAKAIAAPYAVFHAETLAGLDHTPDDALAVANRAGLWPDPAQLAGRIAYYHAAKAMWRPGTGVPSPEDAQVERWLAGGWQHASIDRLAEMKEVFGRLYIVHHLFTAQLTGALGGEYAWLPTEMDWASSRRGVVAPADHTRAQVAISTWLFALQAGLTKLGATQLESAPLPLWRRPSDAEWRSFLDRAPLNRHKLREGHAGLSATLHGASTRVGGKKGRFYDHEQSVEDLLELLAALHGGCVTMRTALGAAGGLGAAFLGVSMPLLLPILGGLWGLAEARDEIKRDMEALRDLPNRLCSNRMDKIAISTLVATLDLPMQRPV